MTIKQLDEFIEKTIKEQNKSKKVWLTLSLWETEDNDDIEFGDCQVFAPDLTSNSPVYEGKVIFGAGYPNKTYSKVINNPTWRDIIVISNNLIIKTRDYDHSFLESIHFGKEENGIRYYDLWFGS